MKKVKFTLGLALAMLLISASFVNAAKVPGFNTDASANSRTSIGYLFFVAPSPHVITVESVFRDYAYNTSRAVPGGGGTFYLPYLVYIDSMTPFTYYGSSVPRMIKKDSYRELVFGTEEYYGFPGALGHFSYGTDGTYGIGINQVFDRNLSISNDIIIELEYKEGVEIMPCIKRTIVLGEWYYENDDNGKDVHGHTGKGNRIDPTDVVVIDYLLADSVTFRPHHDRKTDTARYVFKQELQEVFGKYPIFSISYEITINDEIGTLGYETYEPPMMAEPQNMRGLTFDIGAGITTNIPMNTFGNILYVPSNLHYTFTVFSDKEIDATTNRSNDPYDGISVEKDKTQANAYIVTVKRVQSNFNVKIVQKSDSQSEEGEGTTSNAGTPTDAVWGSNGTIYVNAGTPGTISIYSVTGQLYTKEAISGSYTLSMPKGLYIVQFNGKAYKVVL